MSGIEIYPLGLFNFVPMVIIGYAIFKSNFFDLRTLIFDKKFGFYILASLITLLLVIIVLLISSFYKPEFYDRELYNPFLLIPLVSLFFILLLATYLSGSNPSNKLNLHVSGVILCYGILQILGVFR
ncbi:MAG: hypothetical protein JJT78_17435, partial [Leptospira sp.]|nr:hypothetical protein [Leptospira sp.]